MAVAKFCPECGTATAGAKFCPECGTATALGVAADAEATSAGAIAPGPDFVVASEADAAPPIELEADEQEVWTGTPDAVMSPLAKRTTRYTITTERVKVSSGVMGKRIESLDLFRIRDINVKKSLTQRTRGKGDVKITSTDASTPILIFESIVNPDEVAEDLRRLVRESRKRHGVTTQERM